MDVRDTLFADVPLAAWVTEATPASEPWATFARARDARPAQAIDALEAIVAMPDLESRHYIQAWHALRANGVTPPAAIAKRIDGVVVEVALSNGLDVLAAYADRHARYFNWSGAAVIWEAADGRFDADVAAMLGAASRIVQRIGPWEGPRRGPPPTGSVRLSMLTPSGLHFGEGPMELLMNDALGGPLLAAATKLLQGLTALPRLS